MVQLTSGLISNAIPIAPQLKWSRNCDQASAALTDRTTIAQIPAAASEGGGPLVSPSLMPSF